MPPNPMKPATASDPVAIELVDVCKAFGAGSEAKPAWAVDHMNLKIRAGEFFTFLGPSGCGKTTTLRMIAGFEAPTQGSILLDGHDVSGLPPHRRNVNTVFQSYALFPHLTVEDNVAFGLAVKGVPKAERRERVHAALASVRMGHTADRKPSQLSGGQQQRVALARALVNEPSVLLLDEPFGALDLKLRREMQLEVKDMQRKLGITFVFVTHDQEEALTMSDRIAVMRAGVIHQVDDPVGIYERPADTFTASFIGEMNMLPARVTACGALGVDFSCGGTVVRLSRDAALSPLSPGDTCILAIRPEAISFRAEEGAAGISFFGTAGVSIYIGTDRLCMVTLPTGETLHVRVRNTAGTAAVPQPGSPVQLVCPASAIHRLKNQDL